MSNPDPPLPDFAEPSEVIGARVRDTRKRLGWSVDDLAAACSRVGMPELTPNVLYLIEGGGRGKTGKRSRRRVAIDEVYGLALALDVSPLLLLLPANGDERLAVTPGFTARAEDALVWLIGRSNGSTTLSEAEHAQRYALMPEYMKGQVRRPQIPDGELDKLIYELKDGLSLLRDLKAEKADPGQDGSP